MKPTHLKSEKTRENFNNEWKDKAHCLLDDLERGVLKNRITQRELAKLVGVSRQTLWRDKSIGARLEKIQKHRKGLGNIQTERATVEMRVRQLEAKVNQLQKENGFLIQNIVGICKKLREHGLEPRTIVGEAASDVSIATNRHIAG